MGSCCIVQGAQISALWWLWWPRWVGWGREVGTMGERSKRVRTDVCLQLIWASLGGSDGKDSACSAGDLGLIPVSGRSSGEGNGYLLQYSCLENSMDMEPGGLQSMGLHKSQTRLTFSFTKLIHFIMHQKLTILWSNYIPIKFFFFLEKGTQLHPFVSILPVVSSCCSGRVE